MTFLHLSLFGIGSLFVAIPIALHLMMRQRAKHLLFPALQFVRKRRLVNRRKLQLRHLVLLALRCAAIAVLAAALARPFVASTQVSNWLLLGGLGIAAVAVAALAVFAGSTARRGIAGALATVATGLLAAAVAIFVQVQGNPSANILGDQEAPVAAALVFDVGPSMSYEQDNATRIQRAQELGTWLLRQLPLDSSIAVMESTALHGSFSVDRDAADSQLQGLAPAYRGVPIADVLEEAVRLVRENKNARKEIYVFSDLNETVWSDSQQRQFQEQLELDPPVLVYVIDVSAEDPANLRLHPPELSSEYVPAGQPLEIRVAVDTNQAQASSTQIELLIENQDDSLPILKDGVAEYPALKKRSRRDVTMSAGGTAYGTFVVRGLPPGTNHGQITISSSDGLQVDNRRFFTVDVIEPWRVLVSGSPNAAAHLLTNAIAPPAADEPQLSYLTCETVPEDQLAATDLSTYAAVALVDPGPLAESIWRDLLKYVSNGGGLAIFLGREAVPRQNFNEGPAADLLPGKLQRQWRAGPAGVRLRLEPTSHPSMNLLLARDSTIAWNNFPVFRHWQLSDLRPGANVLIRYSNDLPALLEQAVGKGQVFTFTTPVTDALNVDGRDPWNQLPTGPEPWPYLVMVNELFRHLVQSGENRLNYEVGEAVALRVGEQGEEARIQLFTPVDEWWRELSTRDGLLSFRATDYPGVYRVRRAKAGQPYRGFSVNVPNEATRLTRIDEKRLDEMIGKGLYQVARDQSQINRSVGEARRGREFYPWIMLLLAITLSLESVLANLFYANSDAAGPE